MIIIKNMPSRPNIFVNNYYYHIYNKTLDNLRPFEIEAISNYFLNLIDYYKYTAITMSYSKTSLLEFDQKEHYFNHIREGKSKTIILAFCLMPNHFHLLLKQKQDKGISKYISDILNSITRYFNTMTERKGPIFLPRFKSKPIMNEEHLIHVSRYIHLNPFTSNLIKNIKDIWFYSFSSAAEYFKNKNHITDVKFILDLGYFLGNNKKYIRFVENNSENNKTEFHTKYVLKWSS